MKYFISSGLILNKLIFGTVEKADLETAWGTVLFVIKADSKIKIFFSTALKAVIAKDYRVLGTYKEAQRPNICLLSSQPYLNSAILFPLD